MLPLTKRLLANLMGVKLKTLTYIATNLKDNSFKYYTLHKIPKGNGKYRKVYTVSPKLKFLHSRLKDILEMSVPATGTSYAYETGCTISNTVTRMQNKKLLVAIDFKNHFESVTMWQVTKMLEHHNIPEEVAFLMARLCCITRGKRSFLPQGSILSPLLSNKVCEWLLDPVLQQAFPNALITRYSDNLYLAYDTNLVNGRDTISKLREIVRMSTGWRCHKSKIMPFYRRQKGLGLVLNDHPNMPKEKYQSLKALLFNMANGDPEEQLKRAQEEFGFQEITVPELLLKLKCQLVYWKQFLSATRHSKLTNLLQKAENNWKKKISY